MFGSEFEIKLRNKLIQKAIARECADWIRHKAQFKSNVTNSEIDGFIHVQNAVEQTCFFPIRDLTTTTLGLAKGNALYTQIVQLGAPHANNMIANFNSVWNDTKRTQDVTQRILDSIETVYRENSPELVYFITLYQVFSKFLDDVSEDLLPNEATGFKTSAIWNKLYNFQKDAALGIINKLEKYNGCILADSVGLGKTFTALAVIKYYENRNKSVLVLCPKKLNDNWITYRSNYVNNPLSKDRLRYDILFHTDLSRNSGKSNGLDLSHINWGNYDLVVIDESHNFRNGGKISEDNGESETGNRYQRLMNKVIRSGVKTKVLMLSATPVNNRFNDLKNQLQLAYEGEENKFNRLLNTQNGIDDIFRQAQTAYNRWSKLPHDVRTTKTLQDLLSFDFFEVLDAVTIARSRKHIEQFYDTTHIGKFPDRLTPVTRRPKLTELKLAINYKEIFAELQDLNLAIYTPSAFILPSHLEKYSKTEESEGLTLVGRERGIRQLMSVNLLKRLESSVNSFLLTIRRVRANLEAVINQLDKYSACAQGELDLNFDVSASTDTDAVEDEDFDLVRGKISIQDIDYLSWRTYLEKDLDTLNLLISMVEDITPEYDSKLLQLKEDLLQKTANPINPGNKKVLIFTAFADTALYLYENIAPWLKQTCHLNTALVTGQIEARSTLKLKQKLDFNTVLTLFSPISKERTAVYPNLADEIDVLIATDCISEGQNLQDCDYLINFDIHWNPVRIIQRFGRIDRIGSKNSVIQLVNYWPDLTLDEYIDLKARVEARMKVSVLTSTGDGNPLTNEEQNDIDYRREQLQRLQHEVLDIEEMGTGISIMDLGLNEFRMDLVSHMKENPDIDRAAHGLHAVMRAKDDMPEGVIFVLRSLKEEERLDSRNRIHPFFMVYMKADGEVLINYLQPKELFDRLRLLCKGRNVPDMSICRIFNERTKDGSDMSYCSKLLNRAVASIGTEKEEGDIDSFLSGTTSTLFGKENTQLNDFELISFFVVMTGA